MPVHPDFNPDHLYFVTTSAVNRAPLFQRDVIKRILVDSLNFMRVSGWIRLYCFVIMPNHIHIMVQFISDHKLADVVREFKKHTARQVIRQYQAEENQVVLNFLKAAGTRAGGQDFKVWESGYDARNVFSVDFLRQKLEYIHSNPCQPQWSLVDEPQDYVWSSARFYMLDAPAVIAVDDVRELLA